MLGVRMEAKQGFNFLIAISPMDAALQCYSTAQSGMAQRMGENILPKFSFRKRKRNP